LCFLPLCQYFYFGLKAVPNFACFSLFSMRGAHWTAYF
jgi:hypothetical protein